MYECDHEALAIVTSFFGYNETESPACHEVGVSQLIEYGIFDSVQPKDILNINHDEVCSFSSLEELNLQATAAKFNPKTQPSSPSECHNKEVPIYRVVSKKDTVSALFSAVEPSPFFAYGALKGRFY